MRVPGYINMPAEFENIVLKTDQGAQLSVIKVARVETGPELILWQGFNILVAVVTGFIALAGVAAEAGAVMLIYLKLALKELQEAWAKESYPLIRTDLREAIMRERYRTRAGTISRPA